MSNSRPQPTLADYMAIAISPALIIVLVGSLAFFLLTVFYAGEFEGKMYWTTTCFVVAAVLISRISIVEGAERASLFGIALGAVAALAMTRFTDHPWWAWCVLAIIWWCASHLVWNCTLVDDEDDASGEGLLEIAGLDAAVADKPAEVTAEQSKRTPATKSKKKSAPAPTVAAQPEPVARRFFAWWQKGFSRKALPGLTVVYFSLAALPIFGLGQKFVGTDDRAYAFQLMVRYTASALGLLLTTSFLGLRRYLRQRRLEMPVEMAGAWLGVGAAMAVAILLLAMLIPRPNPEYAISSLTGSLGSWQREASQHALLRDSPGQGESSTQAPANDKTQIERDRNANQNGDAAASAGRSRDGGQATGSTDSSQPPTASGQSGQQTSPRQGQSSQKTEGSSGQRTDNQAEKQETKAAASEKQQPASDAKNQDGQAQQSRSSDQKSASQQGQSQQNQEPDAREQDNQAAKSPPQSGAQKQDQREQNSQARQQQSPRVPPPGQNAHRMPSLRPPPLSTGGWLLWLFKMLLYAAAMIAGIYYLARYWREIKSFLARAWQELVLLWQSLFGVRRDAASSADEEPQRAAAPRPFASFQDPFVSGAVRSNPPNAIIEYSFRALEAWATEHELSRMTEETPLEFGERVAGEHPQLAGGVRELASLYARVAYARESLTGDSLAGVERLWVGLGSSRQAAFGQPA
jgi:hypothetical protein